MNKNITNWNKQAKDNNIHKKIVDTRTNILLIIFSTLFIIVLFGFLTGYFIRLYYYDLYRDLVTQTNICNPIFNSTFQCSNVNVECNCLDKNDLKYLLDDICPNELNIKIYQNSS